MEKVIIGIDISATTLDICKKEDTKKDFFTISNSIFEIRKIFKSLKKYSQVTIAMENTGRYNWYIYEALKDFSYTVFVINPLHLKRSQGLVRGKNDKIDSERIADFASKNQESLKSWKPDSESIEKVRFLFSERNSKVKLRASLLKQQSNYKLMQSKLAEELLKMNKEEISLLEKHIAILEKDIENVIASHQDLKKKSELLKSVPGIGKVLCWMMLIKTGNFQEITEPRKLACYSGVVPFDHQSGTSIRYKPKLSFYADKSLKSILHMAAMSAIRLENDLREYYLRKVAEGKNKMLVLNNVRNKIIHRAFAVINKQKPYEKNYINNLVTS